MQRLPANAGFRSELGSFGLWTGEGVMRMVVVAATVVIAIVATVSGCALVLIGFRRVLSFTAAPTGACRWNPSVTVAPIRLAA